MADWVWTLGAHILSVALDQFGRTGAEGTTMDAIAATAKVSKRTIYLRFGSKRDIILRAIEHGFACHFDPVAAARPPDGPLKERLLYVATKFLNASLKPGVCNLEKLADWALEHVPDIFDRLQNMMNDGPVRLIRSVLEEGVRHGEIAVSDMEFTTRFAFDALVRSPRYRILRVGELANHPRARREYLERAVELLLKALAT